MSEVCVEYERGEEGGEGGGSLWTREVIFVPFSIVTSPVTRTHTHRVVAEQLLLIFRAHPHLVVDYHHDLLDYLSNIRNLSSGGEHCYLHLVRVIPELAHCNSCQWLMCSVENLSSPPF